MSKQMSVSTQVVCTLCKQNYEIAGTTERAGVIYHWLTVTVQIASAQEAIDQATCQVCLNFQDGLPSLEHVLKKLGVALTEPLPTPTPVKRASKFAQPAGFASDKKVPKFAQPNTVGAGSTRGKFAQPTGFASASRGSSSTPRFGSTRRGPSSNSLRTSKHHGTYQSGQRAQEKVATSTVGGAIAAKLIAQLEAHVPGTEKYRSALTYMISMGISHPLVDRKVRSIFANQIGDIKRFLTKIRSFAMRWDVTDMLEDLHDRISVATKTDPKGRSRHDMIKLCGTSREELHRLLWCYWEGRVIAPNSEDGIGKPLEGEVKRKAVPLTNSRELVLEDPCAVWVGGDLVKYFPKSTVAFSNVHETFADANPPLEDALKPVRKIRYPKDAQYGPNPYLCIESDDHAFSMKVQVDGKVVDASFMESGSLARMYVHNEPEWPGYVPRWVYEPHTKAHPNLEWNRPLVNVGVAGFIPLSQAHDEQIEAESNVLPSGLDPDKSIIFRFAPVNDVPFAMLFGQLHGAPSDAKMLSVMLSDDGIPHEGDALIAQDFTPNRPAHSPDSSTRDAHTAHA